VQHQWRRNISVAARKAYGISVISGKHQHLKIGNDSGNVKQWQQQAHCIAPRMAQRRVRQQKISAAASRIVISRQNAARAYRASRHHCYPRRPNLLSPARYHHNGIIAIDIIRRQGTA